MTTTKGFTLVEILVIMGVLSVLAIAYTTLRVNDVAHSTEKINFLTHYQKLKELAVYADILHRQGYRSDHSLDIDQLVIATRGTQWEASASKISELARQYAIKAEDFAMLFGVAGAQLQFYVADGVDLEGYPLERTEVAGNSDLVVLHSRTLAKQSRAVMINRQLLD